jgi:fluoroacetyl-CoA thioesterase
MDFIIDQGISLTLEKTVKKDDTAAHYGSGLVEVFATPAMVAFMEQTALELAQPYLPEGYNTVGTDICVKHSKASPVGMKIRCKATLDRTEGKKLFYSVSVWDENGKVGDGTHTRYIINTEEFMKSLTAL